MYPSFHDHFSSQAAAYGRFRPTYPEALFQYLAHLTPGHRVAWDCATGSGQAAEGLRAHFTRVIATDASTRQLAHARPCENVSYLAALAEQAPLPNRSIDLILVAQALHWFHLATFYREVQRTLKPKGVIAVCCYQLLRVDDATDRWLDELYREVLGPYWPAERSMVDDGYRSLAFPFHEDAPPGFELEADWSYARLIGYLGTWSAVKRYRSEKGSDPVARFADKVRECWDPLERTRKIRWPLALRVGSI